MNTLINFFKKIGEKIGKLTRGGSKTISKLKELGLDFWLYALIWLLFFMREVWIGFPRGLAAIVIIGSGLYVALKIYFHLNPLSSKK